MTAEEDDCLNYLTREQFSEVANSYAPNEDANELFNEFDSDNDGRLYRLELAAFVLSKTKIPEKTI